MFCKRLAHIIARIAGDTLSPWLCVGRSWEWKGRMIIGEGKEVNWNAWILQSPGILGPYNANPAATGCLRKPVMILNVFWTAQSSRTTRIYQSRHQFQQSLNSPLVWEMGMLFFLSLSFSFPHLCCSPSYLFPPSVQCKPGTVSPDTLPFTVLLWSHAWQGREKLCPVPPGRSSQVLKWLITAIFIPALRSNEVASISCRSCYLAVHFFSFCCYMGFFLQKLGLGSRTRCNLSHLFF